MSTRQGWTLSQVAKKLRCPQYRLIHLCEKRAIIPDFQSARGRGSSRRFSDRNLLEFTIALRLRDLTFPVTTIAGILYILREFERRISKERKQFALPHSLLDKNSPELYILVTDGQDLAFLLRPTNGRDKIIGGFDFGPLTKLRQKDLESYKKRLRRSPDIRAAKPPKPLETQCEINVSQIARNLPLES